LVPLVPQRYSPHDETVEVSPPLPSHEVAVSLLLFAPSVQLEKANVPAAQ
jgi:hypothetical protein